MSRDVCECHFDCGQCSFSGVDWHLHDDETCPLHPDAAVIA